MRRKLLAGVAIAAALLLAALALGSLRWRPTRRAGAPRLEAVVRGAGPLLAGAAAVPLEPPAPVPVAGFPRLHWMEEGRRDPVHARALVLREGGLTVALVSAELLLVPGELERAVERRLRDLRLDALVLAATHTHAGPGGFWKEALGERLATGPYREEIFTHLADRIALAVRTAAGALEPAYLATAQGEASALVRNRGGDEVDGRLVAFRVRSLRGPPVAEVILFPSHATLLGVENRLLSGDWPGALMRASGEPLLFFQGALGDQSPVLPASALRGGVGRPEAYARLVAQGVAALRFGPADPWPDLAVATTTTVLPPPDFGATPPPLRGLARNLVYDLLPDRARLVALRVGPLTLLAVPGEPVAEVGRRWRAAAGDGAEVLALAGDYLGYVETSERMAEAAGETVRTYYGPELADRLAAAVRLAAEALRPAAGGQATAALQRAGAPSPQDR